MVYSIPFKLQDRESLGFLASVNLGLDSRTISTLSIVDGGLVRHYGCPSL